MMALLLDAKEDRQDAIGAASAGDAQVLKTLSSILEHQTISLMQLTRGRNQSRGLHRLLLNLDRMRLRLKELTR